MLKCDFLWQPLHVDTAPLGQFRVPKAMQPKGFSAWCWRTLFFGRPWGQEKSKVPIIPLIFVVLTNCISSWIWDAPSVCSMNPIILSVYMLSSFLTGKQVITYTTCSCSSEDVIDSIIWRICLFFRFLDWIYSHIDLIIVTTCKVHVAVLVHSFDVKWPKIQYHHTLKKWM